MLKNKIGVDRLDKLRVIHIFEADVNLLFGIIWSKRLMTNTEKHNTMSDFQWGDRKGRQGIYPLILKVLSFDITAMSRTTLFEADNNATHVSTGS